MPDDEAPARAFARYLAAGQLAFQRCAACAAAIFYPRVLCPTCGATDLRWEISGGRGTVYATTTQHPRGEAPYNVALIDLDEGFRMMSRVEGIAPSEVRIGMDVRLKVLPARDEAESIAVFEPWEPAA
ncbi:MAG TPA: Zn-ribbon domain-containing OB-fold protein [Herpetosiphonaceae bacterium]